VDRGRCFIRKNLEFNTKNPLVQFEQCLVSGMKPTTWSEAQMSQVDPIRTCRSSSGYVEPIRCLALRSGSANETRLGAT
jgi:hypothetical protein